MDILRLLICTTLLILMAKAAYSEDRLYFTNVLDIQLFMNNSTRKVIANLEFAEALDCNNCDQQIYWVDSAGTIKRGSPGNDSSIEVIVKNDLVEPYGLAVDWKGNNVYFSQRRGPAPGHRGQGRIEVVKCDGKYRKVLLDKLGYPGPIALDITRGFLYFAELTDILVVDTDGQNVRLMYTDLDLDFAVGIVGLAVDIETNILYWTTGSAIRWLNLTEWHQNPSPLLPDAVNSIQNTMGSNPHGVFILHNILYWTEPRIISQDDSVTVLREGAIYSLNLQSSVARKLLSNSSISPQDISSFSSMPEEESSEGCANANGGCSHFCFTVPNGQGGTTSRCNCPTGLSRRNNNTCPDFPNNFLLFLQNTTVTSAQTEIRIISLDIEDTYIDVLVPIDIPANSAFLAYDTPQHMVYWTQTDPPAIMRAKLDGTGVEPFITSSIRDPEGIAVEPYSKNLFWVDSTLNHIEVASLRDSQVRKVLIDGLDHPQGIALSLAQGCLYWTDLDAADAKVERAFMDGTGKKAAPESPRPVKKPTDITVDPLTNWVFWADVDRDRDHIVRFDGNTNAVGVELSISPLSEVKGLAVHGDFVYWTDIESQFSIGRARKENGNDKLTLFEHYDGVLGLVAVNVSEEVGTDCDFNSGGCSDLCLPNGVSSTCGCREFFVLDSDGRSCNDIPALVFIATEQALVPYEKNGGILVRPDGFPQWDIQALTIAVDIRGEMIYWISATDNLIYRQSITADYNEPAQEEVISCCLETPENLAVDWLGRNLYWTDSTRGTIEVAKLDGRGRTVLAENLDHPTLIALDPLRGNLYWAPKRNVEVYRMKMSGNESSNELFWRTHLIEDTEGSIFGMAVNYIGEADILYWGVIFDSDSELSIMQSDLSNPDNPIETFTGVDAEFEGAPFHIQTLEEGTVYYHIDGGLNLIVNHLGNIAVVDGTPGKFEDFLIAHHSLQPGIHECSISNGGCFGTETLCLVQDQYRGLCECPAWTVRQVQRTTEGEIHHICLSPDTFVLIATSSDVHFLPVPPANSAVERAPPRPLPVGLFRNISAISYDPINDSILWVDSAKVLRSVTVNASLSWDVLSLSGFAPTSLAYDWVDGHVFVTEKGGFQIELLTVNGEGRGSLLEDIQSPSDVVFDVASSMLYWVDHGRRIKSLSLEDVTRSPQTLPLDGSRLIRQLSYAANHLFWINIDTQSSVISINNFSIADQSESVVLTAGQDITVLTAAAVSGQPYVFWYNTSDRSVYFNDGVTSEVFVQWTAPEDIVAFAGFERPASIPFRLPCLETPRPCSHICNRQFDGSAECACPIHRTLQDDQENCLDPVCGPLFIPCRGVFEECISSYYLCDGIPHCHDGSDELNCTCNTEEQFTCSSDTDTCLDKSRLCDTIFDCPGEEDETSAFCCSDDELGCYTDNGVYSCLPEEFRCDGYSDCVDEIDEENCTTTPTSPSTPPPASTTPSDNPPAKLVTYIAVAAICAIVVLIILIIVLCFLIRVIRQRKQNHYGLNVARMHHFASSKCSNPSPPPSGHRSESVSDVNSELSMGTHSTRLGPYGSAISPSAESTKRFSAGALSTDPSNPPPSPVTMRQSFVMTELGGDAYSAFSQPYSECLPCAPNPSLNYDYDGMSSASVSVSQRQFPAALNGGPYRDPQRHIYGMPGGGVVRRGNPLMSNHHHEMYYHQGAHQPYPHNSQPYSHSHTTHASSSHYHQNPASHQNHHFPFQSRNPTETDSTASVATAQTDNQDVFRYDAIHDVTPPGRPPSPATEVSEHYHHVPTSPASLISDDCSEGCLH